MLFPHRMSFLAATVTSVINWVAENNGNLLSPGLELQVQNQGVCWTSLPLKALGGPFPLTASSGSWCPLAFLGLHMLHSSPCLLLHMALPLCPDVLLLIRTLDTGVGPTVLQYDFIITTASAKILSAHAEVLGGVDLGHTM